MNGSMSIQGNWWEIEFTGNGSIGPAEIVLANVEADSEEKAIAKFKSYYPRASILDIYQPGTLRGMILK